MRRTLRESQPMKAPSTEEQTTTRSNQFHADYTKFQKMFAARFQISSAAKSAVKMCSMVVKVFTEPELSLEGLS